MELDELKVYDPKSEGIDGKMIDELFKKDTAAADRLITDLYAKVEASIVEENKTLTLFLHEYFLEHFAEHRRAATFVFIDGKFHSVYIGRDNEPLEGDIEKLVTPLNSYPFVFNYDVDAGQSDIVSD